LICIKCGHKNPAGVNYCDSCGAILPKMTQAEMAPPAKVNERYMLLKDAGEKVRSGEWSVEEFISFLKNISAILSQKEQEIREIEIPSEAIAEFEEELNMGFSGIELYNQGISEMMLYAEDLNPEHLENGVEMIREGNERINEAMRINRENRRKLEEMYIDTSTLM